LAIARQLAWQKEGIISPGGRILAGAGMARQIKSLIKLTKAQTREFLSNLRKNRNHANRDRTIARARRAKFNVVL